jgi:DNA repair exonuclease SbcCD ATPase subunit
MSVTAVLIIGFVIVTATIAAAAYFVLEKLCGLPQLTAQPITSSMATLAQSVTGAASDVARANERIGVASKAVESASTALVRTTTDLSARHEELSAVVTTVNGDGSLGEWIAALRTTVEPIVHTSSSLGEHFDTTRSLVKTTGELVTEWAEQRKNVEREAKRLTDTMVGWAAQETAHAREVESRILKRLEEVSAIDANVAKGLARLETVDVRLAEAQTDLNHALRTTLDENRGLVKNIQDLIVEYRLSQQRFTKLQAELQERVLAFQKQSETMLADTRKSVDSLVAGVDRSVRTIADDLQRTHKSQEKSAQDILALHEQLAVQQRRYVDQQQSLLEQFDTRLANVPSLILQKAGVGLMIAQTVFMLVLIYVVRTS